MDIIAKPFGMLLLWLYELLHNYGLAIILFALIVKLILLPFQWKSKKGMMRVTRLNPKIKELEKRHEGNQQKYQQEVAKLYKEEKASPMGGCIWTLIPLPILMALYQAIRYPITIMMGIAGSLLEEGGAIATKLAELGFTSNLSSAYIQIDKSQFITAHFDEFASISDKLVALDYNFIGLNLGSVPKWNFFMSCDWSDVSSWLPALGLFLIPVVSAALSFLTTKISQATNPTTANAGTADSTKAADQTANQMKIMNYIMPLFSLYICFSMPAALGIYWIFNSVFSIIQDVALNKIFKKQLDAEDEVRNARFAAREAEIREKRIETERKRAEGETERAANTSKKKLQAKQKAEHDAVKAAAAREERQKRREALGITEEEKPDSQIGKRRYARGRAFVDDRFENPEYAEEATAAAAAESEFGQSIDEDVIETAAPSAAWKPASEAAQENFSDDNEEEYEADEEEYEDDE